jgi:hypothetical protein
MLQVNKQEEEYNILTNFNTKCTQFGDSLLEQISLSQWQKQ